jgi:hypothetical protein
MDRDPHPLHGIQEIVEQLEAALGTPGRTGQTIELELRLVKEIIQKNREP